MTSLVIPEPVASVASPVPAPDQPGKGLRAGALGLISSVVIAVSSTAPAYSMAATLGLIAADVIVMASLSQIAGRYALMVVGADGAAASTVEVGALAVFAVVALAKAATGHALPGAAHPAIGWLNPWTGSFGSLSNSFLLAVFIYWGWDCALSVNEETKDSARTPGRAAVMATVMLVAIFAVISAAALAYAGPAFLAAHSTDVLGAMASSVLGSTPGKLLVLCVLTSTAASTQTTIMPTARTVLAMSAHGAIPRWFARMHPKYRTPTVATLVMGTVSAIFFVLLTAASRNVLADSAASVGLLIAFYYGLTGFACVWFFRHDLLTSARAFLVKGILPLVGGLTLLGAFVLSIKSYWPAASSYSSFHGVGGIFLIGAGSLVVGAAVMLVTARFLPRYFADGIAAPAHRERSSVS